MCRKKTAKFKKIFHVKGFCKYFTTLDKGSASILNTVVG